MKKIILTCILSGLAGGYLLAQDECTLELLAAPATPAATMLGFSPAEIDKPRDVSDFLVSVANSGALSQLPSNYAVEIAPAWLFAGNKISYTSFSGNKVTDNIWQGLTLSAAVRSNDIDTFTQMAFGVKTSLLRGRGYSRDVVQRLALAQAALRDFTDTLNYRLKNDERYNQLLDDGLNEEAEAYRKKFFNNFNSEKTEMLEEQLHDIRLTRTGFKLDLTAGIVQDFPGGRFEQRSVSRAGVWLSGGYEGEKGISFLFMTRYLHSAGYLEEAYSTFDGGARFIYAPAESKFTASGEAIYRKPLQSEALPASWRATLNVEYKFRPAMSLNFSWGRNFDGVVTRNGNVIAVLSVFSSFGNKRKIS